MTFRFSPMSIMLPSLRFPGLEIRCEVGGVPGPDHYFPSFHLLLQAAALGGDIPGDDELAVLDFVGNAALEDGRRDDVGGELARRPGGHHRKPLGGLVMEEGGAFAVFDFARDNEV